MYKIAEDFAIEDLHLVKYRSQVYHTSYQNQSQFKEKCPPLKISKMMSSGPSSWTT